MSEKSKSLSGAQKRKKIKNTQCFISKLNKTTVFFEKNACKDTVNVQINK